MAHFSYRGRNREGAEVNGRVEAASASMAASQLSSEGIIPVNIEQVTAAAGTEQSQKNQPRFACFRKLLWMS